GHGAGPLADLSSYLRHPFPTNLSLPESPSRPKFYNNFDAASGKQQSTPNKRKLRFYLQVIYLQYKYQLAMIQYYQLF
ncbi:MAG: hypothetical protein LBT80_01475, partial [Lactobacillaceae bacterium]|nr:hypothetical protein [Lactobacillaceae bacterium]